MEQAPHLALWPGLCLTIVVYCLNMFGDAMRDLLDPRLRGGEGGEGESEWRPLSCAVSRQPSAPTRRDAPTEGAPLGGPRGPSVTGMNMR